MDFSALLAKQAKLAEASIEAATEQAGNKDMAHAAAMAVDKLMTLNALVTHEYPGTP